MLQMVQMINQMETFKKYEEALKNKLQELTTSLQTERDQTTKLSIKVLQLTKELETLQGINDTERAFGKAEGLAMNAQKVQQAEKKRIRLQREFDEQRTKGLALIKKQAEQLKQADAQLLVQTKRLAKQAQDLQQAKKGSEKLQKAYKALQNTKKNETKRKRKGNTKRKRKMKRKI